VPLCDVPIRVRRPGCRSGATRPAICGMPHSTSGAHTCPVTEGEHIGETAAQTPLIFAAWQFLVPFYVDKDLGAAWPHTDPTLRLCWAQWWADANRNALQTSDYDLDEVARALAIDNGRHDLWPHFERVVIRDFQAACPLDSRTWSIGTAPRLVAPDIELLYVHRELPVGGYWAPNAAAEVVPLVMRLTDDVWRVMNLGSEAVPEPGWPPKLR
jgi:hypothetical protein